MIEPVLLEIGKRYKFKTSCGILGVAGGEKLYCIDHISGLLIHRLKDTHFFVASIVVIERKNNLLLIRVDDIEYL